MNIYFFYFYYFYVYLLVYHLKSIWDTETEYAVDSNTCIHPAINRLQSNLNVREHIDRVKEKHTNQEPH